MKVHRFLCLAVFALIAARAESQDIVVGSVDGGFGAHNAATATFINTAEGANADGTVTTALVRFESTASCSGTFSLRFYRSNGTSLAMIAERGPFPIEGRTKIVALDPPVDLLRNDLIGLFQQPTGGCGISFTYGGSADAALRVESDFRGGPLTGSYGITQRFRFAFRASSQKLVLAGIIPVVGSTAGAFGSQFRTSFQITNPDNEEMLQGLTFVYRPRVTDPTGGASATLDASPNATNAADLIGRMNITGVGSLDVYTPLWPPVMSARVYNDTASGTNGFSEPLIPVSRTLHSGEHGRFTFPADLTNYRMNVGIRTLGNAVIVTGTQWDAAGTSKGNVTRNYPANFFDQVSLAAFAPASATEGGNMSFQVIGGDVIIYTTITDNRTNDSAITLVTRD